MIISIIAILAVSVAAFYLFRKYSQMQRCDWCNKLRDVSENGICDDCLAKIRSREKARVDKIISNYKVIDSTRPMHIRLTKLDENLSELKKLFMYEDRGIVMMKPSAHKRFLQLKEKHDKIIHDAAVDKIMEIKGRLEATDSPSERASILNSALLYVVDLKMQLIIHTQIMDDMENDLKAEILRLKVRGFIAKAIDAEKHGQKEEAVMNYSRAAEYIKANDHNNQMEKDYRDITLRMQKIAA